MFKMFLFALVKNISITNNNRGLFKLILKLKYQHFFHNDLELKKVRRI